MSGVIEHNQEKITLSDLLPVLPLRDVVVFPGMSYPLLIGRASSLEAVNEARKSNQQIFLCAQKKSEMDAPQPQDLYAVGTIARIQEVTPLPNGTQKVLVEGLAKAEAVFDLPTTAAAQTRLKKNFSARLSLFKPEKLSNPNELEALTRSTASSFQEYVRLNRRMPEEILLYLNNITDPQRLADTLSAHILQKVEVRQKLLEAPSAAAQLRSLLEILNAEIEILKIEEEIDTSVRENVTRTQREFYLRQQLAAIKEELGQMEEGGDETADFAKKLASPNLPKEVREKGAAELGKLKKMYPYSSEATVVRGYLEWLLAVPWGKETKDVTDFKEVKTVLDADHYGLKKPKERILEHLAVMRLSREKKGSILCLVGPPGVGKTSLGRSVARALGRNFVRMSLGGVRDEAELRGHRRTYIGSLPGRIVQGLKKADSINPVFLLDEVDKLGADYRGDPAAALLEILDPEQNRTFVDHYLEAECDLSKILFITTANHQDGIPLPLLDRMEIIRLSGYLEHEKLAIAKNYLFSKLTKELGTEKLKLTFTETAILEIIRRYTKESGVRELERQMAAIMRKLATRKLTENGKTPREVTPALVGELLGAPPYLDTETEKKPAIGRAMGLAWTERGGELLPVEVALMPGGGNFTLTGKLGEVMQESAKAALSFLRANHKTYGLKRDFFRDLEVHIHILEGAVPKDGPSAGITMAVALLSALTKKPVKPGFAMTGEITLSGKLLPIGGLNEKILAAKQAGIKHILLPKKNEKDLAELPAELKESLTFHKLDTLAPAFDLVFQTNTSRTH
ncbi:MAG: endopeptidase La [candidate division Zixibacteria bacterium]|nr:endopeptidase La [candidate division Zixibacteria bacterium]